jgi:hypothetical protein
VAVTTYQPRVAEGIILHGLVRDHLVDEVLPRVPVRQWVLTMPHRLRYLLAWDHKLCRAVLAVYVRAVPAVMAGCH